MLIPYRKRLGDLLLENKLLTEQQLQQAIVEQQKTGQRLGHVLQQLKMLTNNQLIKVLSGQYNLPLFPQHQLHEATMQCFQLLSKRIGKWLMKHEVKVVYVDDNNKTMTIAITDPTNELMLTKIINYFKSYEIKFVLIEE